jgi:hypothetical protein
VSESHVLYTFSLISVHVNVNNRKNCPFTSDCVREDLITVMKGDLKKKNMIHVSVVWLRFVSTKGCISTPILLTISSGTINSHYLFLTIGCSLGRSNQSCMKDKSRYEK